MEIYSNPIRNNIINASNSFWLCNAVILSMTFPQVKQKSKWHEPHLILRKVQMCKSVIKKSGKQLIVCYPTFVFFESNSLSIFLFVPLCIESIIAFLYSARSYGEVISSSSSSLSKGFLLFGFFRL